MQLFKIGFVSVLCLTSLVPWRGNAQILYKQTGNSYISISGTSTLHEWTMTSKEGKYATYLEFGDQGELSKVASLHLSVRSESLKSGHTAMDQNAYSTLSTDVHKTIHFELQSAVVADQKVQCTGTLTVAGITRQISVDVSYKKLTSNTLLFWGTKKLKMSDFSIEPPAFMFGTVITGDEITVSFNVELTPAKK